MSSPTTTRSPVSIINELHQSRTLDAMEFADLGQISHSLIWKSACQIRWMRPDTRDMEDIIKTGTGRSKRIAKDAAALAVLQHIYECYDLLFMIGAANLDEDASNSSVMTRSVSSGSNRSQSTVLTESSIETPPDSPKIEGCVNPWDEAPKNFVFRQAKTRDPNQHTPKQLAIIRAGEIERDRLEELGRAGSNQSRVWLAIDVEAWERNTKVITEVGLAFCETAGAFGTEIPSIYKTRHLIVKEHIEKRNERWVGDEKDNFAFGHSEFISADHIGQTIQSQINDLALDGEVILVGHALAGDVMWLKSLGVEVGGMKTIDTQKVWSGQHQTYEPMSLTGICCELGLAPEHLHNAGNDAYWTLAAAMELSR